MLTLYMHIFLSLRGIVLPVASPQRLIARRSMALKCSMLASDAFPSSLIPLI